MISGDTRLRLQCEKLYIDCIDGAIYRGGLVNGEPNGKGIATDANGNCYKGGFGDGRPHRKGIGKYPNGDVLESDFVGGYAIGQGVLS